MELRGEVDGEVGAEVGGEVGGGAGRWSWEVEVDGVGCVRWRQIKVALEYSSDC